MQKKVHLPVSWSEHKKFDLKCTSLDSNKRDSRKIINLCTFLLLTHKTFLINKNSINSASIYNLWSWHLILSFHLPLLRSCWEFFSSLFLPLKIAPNFSVDYNKIYLRLKARFLVEFLNLCNFFIIHPYGPSLTWSSLSTFYFFLLSTRRINLVDMLFYERKERLENILWTSITNESGYKKWARNSIWQTNNSSISLLRAIQLNDDY